MTHRMTIGACYMSDTAISSCKSLGCQYYDEVVKLDMTDDDFVRMAYEIQKEIRAFIAHEKAKLALEEAKRVFEKTSLDSDKATAKMKNWEQNQPKGLTFKRPVRHTQKQRRIRSPSGAFLKATENVKVRHYKDSELTKSGRIRASSKDLDKKRRTAKLLDELGV